MNLEQDVLIVGSGVSGLYCALNLDKSLNVLVVSKSTIENNNTYLAQGGISTLFLYCPAFIVSSTKDSISSIF
ncbi:FAD-dependent oxidoreductase, partial [Clostridioides difficile]|uniref:FAD-dependent oxidoreductase n=1 Tax=Clostridioides difficile TaxID=1496 RepID=UPI001F1AF232